MPSFDVRKKSIGPFNPRHSQHGRFMAMRKRQARRQVIIRSWWGAIFGLGGVVLILPMLTAGYHERLSQYYEHQAVAEMLHVQSYAKNPTPLPVAEADAKQKALVYYLQEKGSPLAKYAGELSRLPHWKPLIAIGQAESGLCKKTQRNNCWGIGPNNVPWSFKDISESLYYANYLLSKYQALGLDPNKPETIVRTYVGYDHPGWVNNVKDTLLELKLRGIE